MTESDFWPALEYRVCRELEGLEEARSGGLWCDGFIPEDYVLDEDSARIEGRVWIGQGGTTDQQLWRFTLFTNSRIDDVTSVDWRGFLPGDDETGWLKLDMATRELEVNLAKGRGAR